MEAPSRPEAPKKGVNELHRDRSGFIKRSERTVKQLKSNKKFSMSAALRSHDVIESDHSGPFEKPESNKRKKLATKGYISHQMINSVAR
jgi:hypothetical protein